MNRDPEQYNSILVEDDTALINECLNWWTADDYNFYEHWISDTVNAMGMKAHKNLPEAYDDKGLDA